ncbi:hypothetical protein ADIAL_0802 [Alkalibacterium sp. AK22]|uniref:hypothetical protein n=1 Tax=Alkalibacterium sp. AK22 TaxID=1229520 RepID=UPI0004509C6E|nr:hypothetical protein [Alkalibacterium sp. AK22]EXJ23687.1 hypothetical protein ADIAL_0802 [Alkalibacterium sp. AK22]
MKKVGLAFLLICIGLIGGMGGPLTSDQSVEKEYRSEKRQVDRQKVKTQRMWF